MHHTGARPILWPKKTPSWWVLDTLNDFVNDKECHQGSRSMRSVNSFHADNMTARRYYFEAPHIQCMQGLHFLHVLCPHHLFHLQQSQAPYYTFRLLTILYKIQ